MIGYVYLADTHYLRRGICKVGFSLAPEIRMNGLSVPGGGGRPHLTKAWRVFGPRRAEGAVHARLADRAVGNEWFRIEPEEGVEMVERVLRDGRHLWDRRKAWFEVEGMWSAPDSPSVKRIAETTGISVSTLYRAERNGDLPPRNAQPVSAGILLGSPKRKAKK